MVYYLNESKSSINDLCNEYTLSINEALHEYNMSILSGKYNFICENGYEMPINEAEEKKQGFFKQLIQRIKAALKKLCDKAITKLKSFMSNHPESKLNPFINKINNIFTKASNKLDKSKSTDEAKEISNDAGEEVKNTTEEATKNKSVKFADHQSTLTAKSVSNWIKSNVNNNEKCMLIRLNDCKDASHDKNTKMILSHFKKKYNYISDNNALILASIEINSGNVNAEKVFTYDQLTDGFKTNLDKHNGLLVITP